MVPVSLRATAATGPKQEAGLQQQVALDRQTRSRKQRPQHRSEKEQEFPRLASARIEGAISARVIWRHRPILEGPPLRNAVVLSVLTANIQILLVLAVVAEEIGAFALTESVGMPLGSALKPTPGNTAQVSR